jgi:muconolactone delta-isomerase
MRFLVIIKPKHMVPPEVNLKLLDAVGPWQSKHGKKIEMIWAFAGTQGGGGIANVDSLEELDAVMAEFPLLGASDVEILPIVDMNSSLQRVRQAIQAMSGGG